jgi:hypothetical protein
MSGVNELIAWAAQEKISLSVFGAYVTIIGIIVLYVILAVAIFVTLLFPLIQTFKDLKAALGVIAGVGALVLLFMFCYWLGAAEPFSYDTAEGVKIIPEGTMRIVEACIYMLYMMLCAAILSVIVAPVVSYLKK